MAATKAKAKDSGEKVFDVARPGKGKTDATSRPIIITNRPMLQDPMMVDESAEPASTAAAPTNTNGKASITPINVISHHEETESKVSVNASPEKQAAEAAPVEPAAVQPEEPKVAAPAAPEVPAEKAAEPPAPVSETVPPEAPQAAPAEDDNSANEEEKSAPEQSPADVEAAAREAEKQAAEHQAATQKLVESKQYYLPINTVEQRKTKRFIALGVLLSLVLAATWVDVALDAGLVHVGGLHALTHFFTN